MSSETKNLLIAIILSMGVMMIWSSLSAPPPKEPEDPKAAIDTTPEISAETPQIAPIMPEELPDRYDMIKQTVGRITLENSNIKGTINLQGGSFDDLTLLQYKETLDEDSKQVALLSPAGTINVYYMRAGFASADKNISVPDHDTVWWSDNVTMGPDKPAILSWKSPEGLDFKRIITVDDRYMFNIKDIVTNNSVNNVKLAPYGLISRSSEMAQTMFISHEGPVSVFDGELTEYDYDDILDDKSISEKDKTGWFGIGDKYWLSGIIPPRDEKFNFKASYQFKEGLHRFQTDYIGAVRDVNVGESFTYEYQLYAGAKKVTFLDDYRDNQNITLFDRAVDFGWLYFLTKPMFYALNWLNEIVGNFGIAILIFTVFVKLLLFPLNNKSYRSMARMKQFMPEISKLRERHKGDRMKLNQEMMKLYKTQKINPASGCLPLIPQIFIFFALYKVLFVTIEMRHAPFYGWINDLSAPDPTNILNLFGLLPYDLPTWLPNIGVWPILFAVSMFIQQKLNPTPQDPTQAMIIKWMPWVLLFLFAGFPAGLVIYWTWNNVLTILQQWVITKKINKT